MYQNARMETLALAEVVRQAVALARVPAETHAWYDAYQWPLRRAAADGSAVLPIGLELIGSADPVERRVGCDLLGDASSQNEAVRADVATALVALAERESEASVLWPLARAIESTRDQRAIPFLVALAGHADAELRERAATSFAGVLSGLPDGPDIRALIQLTRDEDPEVRNWATFTLGCQAEVDSPAIRAALWARTTDEFGEARDEGIRGLARCHDPRAIPLLVELLDDPDRAHALGFHAARMMGAPELLPALLEYEPDDSVITAAVNACDPVVRGQLDARAWELVCALHRTRPDLGAGISMPRFDSGVFLSVAGGEQYDVEALLSRADGSPERAAELVAADWS